MAGAHELLSWAFALAATGLWIRLAPRVGLVDAPELARKHQRAPVPAVGGLALATTWLALGGFGGLRELLPAEVLWCSPERAALAGAAALALGLLDDLLPGGLRAGWKLALQGATLAVLWHPLVTEQGLAPPLAVAALVLLFLAWNAFAIFDNADGAAAGTALVGLALPAPLLAASIAGFLPFNLRGGDARRRAYLGNAGSHGLGLLLVLVPAAWPVLVLPILDAVRVSLARARAGQPIWVGDRRHLAHRLQERGVGRLAVFASLALAAVVPALLGHWARRSEAPAWPLLGAIAAAAGAFAWLSRCARAARRAA